MPSFYIKLIPLFIFTASIGIAKAQNPSGSIKEIGLGTRNFDNFFLQYRWGSADKIQRVSGRLGYDGDFDTDMHYSENNFQIGFHYTSFKLRSLGEKVGWFYGWSTGINMAFDYDKRDEGNTITKNNNTQITPRIGGIIGLYYTFNSVLSLYGELNPYFYYRHNISSNKYDYPSSPEAVTKRTSNTFGISRVTNSNVMLTLAYKFHSSN